MAHEYFTADWESFYFQQVAEDLGRFGLGFAGCLLLARDLPTSATLHLASEAVGTALTLSRSDALLVLGVHEAGLQGAAAWAKAWSLDHGLEPETVPALERLPLELLGLG